MNLAYFLQSPKEARDARYDTAGRYVLAAMARNYADVFGAIAPALPRDPIPNLASDKTA